MLQKPRRYFVLFLAIYLIFNLSSVAHSADTTYYVAPDGDDSNVGSLAQPWRTIQKAADTVSPGDTVLIQPGIYRENIIITRSGTEQAPIIFRADDGGVQQGDEAVRLWGSEDSREMVWADLNDVACDATLFSQVAAANHDEIFCTDLSQWTEDALHIVPDIVAQIDSGGGIQRLVKAREPDLKIETEWKHHEFWWAADGGTSTAGGGSSTWLYDVTNDSAPVGLESGNLASLGDLSGATLFSVDNVTGFYLFRRHIKQMLPEGCTPNVDCTGIQIETANSVEGRRADFDFGTKSGYGKFTKYFVEGLPQLLDQPGEWVYDGPTQKLYIWSGQSPTTQHIEIAKRHYGLSFSDPNEISASSSHIKVDGLSLDFINANYRYNSTSGKYLLKSMLNFNSLHPSRVQGALTSFNWRTDSNKNLMFENLQITHSSNGLQIFQEAGENTRTSNVGLYNSEIAYIDGQAIRVHAEINESGTTFPAIEQFSVINNHIHHIGFRPGDFWLDQGPTIHLATKGMKDVTLKGNVIEHTGQIGLALQGSAPGEVIQNILVEDNRIAKTCENSTDCAAFYLWGEADSFTDLVVVENIFEETLGWSYVINSCRPPYEISGAPSCEEDWWDGGAGGHGIYMDRAGGAAIYRNLLRRNGFAGIYISTTARQSTNYIYNNVIEANKYGLADESSGDFEIIHIKNNVFYENETAGMLLDNLIGQIEIDHNLYKNSVDGDAWILDSTNLENVGQLQAQTEFDTHSLMYIQSIFEIEPATELEHYAPIVNSALIDQGDEIPDFPGLNQANDYPISGLMYDIGLFEYVEPDDKEEEGEDTNEEDDEEDGNETNISRQIYLPLTIK